MNTKGFTDRYSSTHQKRFERTLSFMDGVVNTSETILDLGPSNPFSELLREQGFEVFNTPDKCDLDLEFDMVKDAKYKVVTGFEILEHMVSPFPMLKSIHAKKLFISVPLRLWFAEAYWNDKDPFDRHYHEFEPKQLEMLLNKAGWHIVKSEKWKGTALKFGIRPLLRSMTPRYIIVYCERK